MVGASHGKGSNERVHAPPPSLTLDSSIHTVMMVPVSKWYSCAVGRCVRKVGE